MCRKQLRPRTRCRYSRHPTGGEVQGMTPTPAGPSSTHLSQQARGRARSRTHMHIKSGLKIFVIKISPVSLVDISAFGRTGHRGCEAHEQGHCWPERPGLTVLPAVPPARGSPRRAPPGHRRPGRLRGEATSFYMAKPAILEFREGLSRWVFTASTFRVIVSTLQPYATGVSLRMVCRGHRR